METGSQAEYVSVKADRLMVLPDSMGWEEAGGLAEAGLTAFQVLYYLGQLKDKQSVFVHAAASGVGTMAIQMAKRMSQAQVFGSASQKFKLDVIQQLGVDQAINYQTEDIVSRVMAETDGQGVDLILDFVGASNWQLNLDLAAVDGRWILIGSLGGLEVDRFNLLPILQKRLRLEGTLLSPRSDSYKAQLARDFSKYALPYYASGDIQVVIDQIFDFGELVQAHERMEDNKNIGKIIVRLD